MRMWNIDPRLMCDKHLLGEHVEMHMFAASIALGKNIQGYIDKNLVEVENIVPRHQELADEMNRRGMKHLSGLRYFNTYGRKYTVGHIDKEKSHKLLCERCNKCNDLALSRIINNVGVYAKEQSGR